MFVQHTRHSSNWCNMLSTETACLAKNECILKNCMLPFKKLSTSSRYEKSFNRTRFFQNTRFIHNMQCVINMQYCRWKVQRPLHMQHSFKKKDSCQRKMLVTCYNLPWQQDILLIRSNILARKLKLYCVERCNATSIFPVWQFLKEILHCFKMIAVKIGYLHKQEAIFLQKTRICGKCNTSFAEVQPPPHFFCMTFVFKGRLHFFKEMLPVLFIFLWKAFCRIEVQQAVDEKMF